MALATFVAVVAGCASRSPAPIAERAVLSPARATAVAAGSGFHIVRKGDTLYSIAQEYGHDYRDIVEWNALENANIIRVGQQLRVAPPAPQSDQGSVAVVKAIALPGTPESRPLGEVTASAPPHGELYKREPKGGKAPYSEDALAQARTEEKGLQKAAIVRPAPEAAKTVITPATAKADRATNDSRAESDIDWIWPSKGKVLVPFSEGGNSGIDFDGEIGDPVLAASGGEVIFAKDGIRGFGNLVIIKHNPEYISVYAHNSRILVKEKQAVTKGQKIAELGSSDTDRPRLHFEIRRQAKPVDPVKYLPQL